MRKRHQEEAAELAQLNHELVTLKSDITVTAQVNDKLEELAGNIKVLKEINYDLMMERARHCDNARKMHKSINDTKKETKAMKKSVEDAKDETKAMKSRLDDMGKVYNELIRDMYYERGKRVQVEQTLQEFLAAQKAIAEKFGARLV
jgi:HAMP domain-containing protein